MFAPWLHAPPRRERGTERNTMDQSISGAMGILESSHCRPSSDESKRAPSNEEHVDDNKMDRESPSNVDECPLFMDSLPSDFASNGALAALASLLESEDEDKGTKGRSQSISKISEKSPINSVEGGGKARRSGGRGSANKFKPYLAQGSKKIVVKPSMGEAQLFMSMWKI